jgi:hypothetical protein
MSLLDDLRVIETSQDTDLKKEIYNEVINTLTPYMNDLLQQVHRCNAEIDMLKTELNSRMENKVDKFELDYLINKIRGYRCY